MTEKNNFTTFIAPCFTGNTERLIDLYVRQKARKTLEVKHRWILCSQSYRWLLIRIYTKQVPTLGTER